MITDNKLRQLFELKKSIDIIGYELTSERLAIRYMVNGTIERINTNVLEACSLLKEAGLIVGYADENLLQWETETNTERNGEHYQECKTVYGSFKDFVEQTRFTLNDANEVVAFYIINNQKELA